MPPFARNWCFFLDIDGTLLEFADRPESVRVDAGLMTILERLHHVSAGATALISGRRIADIDRLFSPLTLAAAGQHGIERRTHAGLHLQYASPAPYMPDEVDAIERLVAQHQGLVLEDKGATLAVHYRHAPQFQHRVTELMHALRDALQGRFELQTGKMVIEIKPEGRDKGTAIAEFMDESPFLGRVPVFIGDDLTDEYGFTLINSRQGYSVKVGEGSSVAHWRLTDARAVRGWLAAYVDYFRKNHNL